MRLSLPASPIRLLAAALTASSLLAAPAFSQNTKQAAQAKAKAVRKARARATARAIAAQPKPTHANVPYGDLPRQVLDFYQAESDSPTPLVVYIHGGGWMGGDKARVGTVNLKQLLDNGISVAAINYRFIPMAEAQGVKPPVKAPLHDAARAVQFLRSKADDWNIDKTRLGASGGSAGACSSLWLAFHPDLADPDSDDPVARQSTRLSAAAVAGAQTSLDPKLLREWMPNMAYGGHAFGFRKPGQGRDAEFNTFFEHRDDILDWIHEYSPYDQVSSDDPPVFLSYGAQPTPFTRGTRQKDPTHSALLGILLEEKLKQEGVESHLSYPGHKDPDYPSITAFLIAKLKSR